jgi:site-specific recombinase XerD
MTTIDSAETAISEAGVDFEIDEAQLAAVSFLARYSGRTLEAYRHDLRGFFQWASDHSVAVMEASRAHIELFRAWMEDRGLAASTIDRRLSTVCGFYRTPVTRVMVECVGSPVGDDVLGRSPPALHSGT